MRVWRNAVLNFAVTSFDVGVAPAIEQDRSFSFKTLHSKCNTPVKQQHFCPTCNKVADEVVKGFEFPKGQYIPVTEEEISSTRPKTKNIITISKFVHADMLNEMLYADPYWLIPNDKDVYAQAYAAFKVVMLVKNRVGLGTVAFTDKEHPVALTALEDGLCLWMLNQPSQLRLPDWELPLPSELATKQAQMLMELMVEPIADDDFELPTKALQRSLVNSKTAGKSVKAVEQVEATAVPDVLASLKESIALMQARKKAQAKPRSKSRA